MQNREIKPEEFWEFFERFSRQHHHWLVSIKMIDKKGKETVVAQQTPLNEIRLSRVNNTSVTISAGDKAESRNTQTIENMVKVILHQTDEGAHLGLFMESEEGKSIELRFHSTALPESLNGIA